MGKAKFTKLMALILALTFLVGGGTVATFAADDQESVTSEETNDSRIIGRPLNQKRYSG